MYGTAGFTALSASISTSILRAGPPCISGAIFRLVAAGAVLPSASSGGAPRPQTGTMSADEVCARDAPDPATSESRLKATQANSSRGSDAAQNPNPLNDPSTA